MKTILTLETTAPIKWEQILRAALFDIHFVVWALMIPTVKTSVSYINAHTDSSLTDCDKDSAEHVATTSLPKIYVT